MPLNIISNFAANVAHRNLKSSDMAATSSLAKLSAGTRVLGAKDDAASMAVGSRLAAEVAGLKQASVNAGQGISMLQIADGAMAKVNDILTRMKTLAIQAGSGQLANTERAMLDTEYQSLVSEVDRIALDTDFAGTALVSGSVTVDTTLATSMNINDGIADITFRGNFSTGGTASRATGTFDAASDSFTVSHNSVSYTGTIATTDVLNASTLANSTVVTLTGGSAGLTIDLVLDSQLFAAGTSFASQSLDLAGSATTSFTYKVGTGVSATADDITVSVDSISTGALGISGNIASTGAAATSIGQVNAAIDALQSSRATIGANQNRLDFAAANIATASENTEAARSQLLDLDVAQEMSSFTSKQILVQAGVAMLAQANNLPQNLLRLFQ